MSVHRLPVIADAGPERLSITLINSLYPPIAVGGAEKVVQNLAESQAKAKHRVSVITLSPHGGGVEQVGGITVVRLPTDVPWPFGTSHKSVTHRIRTKIKDRYSATMRDRVCAVLSELRPDVVHTNSLLGFSVSVWDAARSLDLPVVHTAHDWYLPCMRSTMLRAGRVCARQCGLCSVYTERRRSASARVSAFVGVSEFVRQTHLACGFFDKTPVATTIHNPSPALRPAAAPESNHSGPLRLGFLGRIEAAKGIELLLAALRPLKANFRLHIGGTGNTELVDRLRSQYSDPRFVWLGRVEPDEFYSGIDVLVVPSLWNEPFGLVIGEAFSHGIPVIAARRGGIPEIVRDEITGVLFDPAYPSQLADAVLRLAADRSLIAAMSAQIRSNPPERGDDDWAGSYARLYARVARRFPNPMILEMTAAGPGPLRQNRESDREAV
jgi:glycosyltransferase involved in cell wall biosynthesis